jgi:hypothetical protein
MRYARHKPRYGIKDDGCARMGPGIDGVENGNPLSRDPQSGLADQMFGAGAGRLDHAAVISLYWNRSNK